MRASVEFFDGQEVDDTLLGLIVVEPYPHDGHYPFQENAFPHVMFTNMCLEHTATYLKRIVVSQEDELRRTETVFRATYEKLSPAAWDTCGVCFAGIARSANLFSFDLSQLQTSLRQMPQLPYEFLTAFPAQVERVAHTVLMLGVRLNELGRPRPEKALKRACVIIMVGTRPAFLEPPPTLKSVDRFDPILLRLAFELLGFPMVWWYIHGRDNIP